MASPEAVGVSDRNAVIAGATGAVGGALARTLAASPHWRVLGLSRRPPRRPVQGVLHVPLDLRDAAACRALVAAHPRLTHLFYCARASHGEVVIESAEENLALLETLLDVLSCAAPGFAHVHLVQGGKVYGVHLGPFPTPATEDQPRMAVENFNYDHEDLLRRRSASAAWSWSASRPNTLMHFAPGQGRNLVSSLGAYAALCRMRGQVLDFPGPEAAFDSRTQLTSTALLCRAIDRVSTQPAAADLAFNVTNGDTVRWRDLWAVLAAVFGLIPGEPRPRRLAQSLEGAEADWAALCAAQGLREPELAAVANWDYLEATLGRTWDEVFSTERLRALGFTEGRNTPACLRALLERYRDASILP